MYKIKYQIFLTLFAFTLNSQELDENFLDSLPEDIRRDVAERAEGKKDDTDNNYNSFLYSSKLEQAEELLELKKRLESDLRELERRLKSDERLTLDDDLKLFGSNFFNTFQTSFMPINEPNPDSTYTLDIGDILNIQLIGQQSYDEEPLLMEMVQ